MVKFTVMNKNNNAILASDAVVADTFYTRLRGLIGTPCLLNGQGLLIRPCNSIHTVGMRYSIDVLFLSSDLRIIKMVSALKPLRLRVCIGSVAVLELPAGTIKETFTEEGHVLVVLPSA
ncbi:MAG: hypothetical protein H6Q73_1694 [Firmicutes bacterium]|nr:hypothetical protein [Bacillota bacterium]